MSFKPYVPHQPIQPPVYQPAVQLLIQNTANGIADLYSKNISSLAGFDREKPDLKQLKLSKNPLSSLSGIENMRQL